VSNSYSLNALKRFVCYFVLHFEEAYKVGLFPLLFVNILHVLAYIKYKELKIILCIEYNFLLISILQKYCYMTGGSRSRFLIGFALCQQLNIYKKSGFHNKLSTKPGNSWIITFIGKETDTPLEVDIKEGVVSEQSESEKNDEEEEEDYLDSCEGTQHT